MASIFDSVGSALSGGLGAGLASGALGIAGSALQASQQNKALKRALKYQTDWNNQGRRDVTGNLGNANRTLQPYATAGTGAQNALTAALSRPGQLQFEPPPDTSGMSRKQANRANREWMQRTQSAAKQSGVTLPQGFAGMQRAVSGYNQQATQPQAGNWYNDQAGPGGLLHSYGWGDYQSQSGQPNVQMADLLRAPTWDELKGAMDPAYEFNRNQGLEAIQQSAAAHGMLNSGGTLKALDRYATDYADTKLGEAYSRVTGNQNRNLANFYGLSDQTTGQGNTMYNRLTGSAQRGQSAASGIAGNYMGAGNALAGIATGQGSQGAANLMGQGQAAGDMWGNATNALTNGIGQGLFYDWIRNAQGQPGNGSSGASNGFSYANSAAGRY